MVEVCGCDGLRDLKGGFGVFYEEKKRMGYVVVEN